MAFTGLLTDPIYLEHDTGDHPECAERLSVTVNHLESGELWNELTHLRGVRADIDLVQLVHDKEYVQRLEREINHGARMIGSLDCQVCSRTFEVALYAAGGALELTKQVSAGTLKNGLGLVRPPGHHAEREKAMGFCYLNNIAICAEYLVKKEGYRRVLIIDFDVHHGNGTQHSFEDRNDIFYCSIHEDPRFCYPGTGFREEKGIGPGEGYTLNVPVPPFSTDAEYSKALQEILRPAWESYQPDFILISAGFDAHRDDPLAQVNITIDTFLEYTKVIGEVADQFCGGKMVSLLEGGYNLQQLPKLIEGHLRALMKKPFNQFS